MLVKNHQNLTSILQSLAENIDIPDHAYEDAILKYEDIADHLNSDDSVLVDHEPKIYTQGSFRLGTVVQPYNLNDEYDIDLVCELKIKKESVTQRHLKTKVGERLKAREDLAKILIQSRRCWTLDYPAEAGMPRFHMDVLPSIPNEERGPTGILLTDTELTRWQRSNPVAYAEWFKKRMDVVFRARKIALAESMHARFEEVPDWRIKTPLQRSVQILKRHRDIYFQDKPEIKPASIILTTLAAHAYQNEEDISDALTEIVNRMPDFIENRNGSWWVQNPVDDGENFADKWNQYPERRTAFVNWLQKVRTDFINLSDAETIADGLNVLNESIGRKTMDKVATTLGVHREDTLPAVAFTARTVPALGNASHALSPATQFPIAPSAQHNVRVTASVHFKRGSKKGRFLWSLRDEPVPRSVWIKFTAKTNFPEPYSIRWQVVNTGEDAMRDNQPRGDFYSPDHSDKHVRWESTAYRGTHWVEAFVLDGEGRCVAQSGRHFVKVR